MLQNLPQESSKQKTVKELRPGDFVVVAMGGCLEEGQLHGVFKYSGLSRMGKLTLVNAPDIQASDIPENGGPSIGSQYQWDVYSEDIVAICADRAQAWRLYRGLRSANQKKKDEIAHAQAEWAQTMRQLLEPFTPLRAR